MSIKKYNDYHYERIVLNKLSPRFNEIISKFDSSKSVEEQSDLIREVDKVFSEYSTYQAIAHLNFARDTRSKETKAESEYYDKIDPSMSEFSTRFAKVVVSSKYRDELVREWGRQYFNLLEMELKTFDPKIKEMLIEESKLKNEYTVLLASAKIPFKGKIYNLTGLGPFHTDLDRGTRKSSYKARFSFFEENSKKLDNLYDQLVKLRHRMALELGYKNYIPLGYLKMSRSDYDAKAVAGYREQIVKHVVPLAEKLYQQRKDILNLEKLYFYDGINFPEGNPKPEGTPDELVAAAQKMYHELSSETGEFFDRMVNEKLLDLVNRKGKAGGGFCTSFPDYERPYIFANFNGTDHDVTVLTHEAGHAFQCYSSRKQQLVTYLWPTMESAEIHSMSMEFITWPWMERFFGDQAEKFRYMHMVNAVLFLPYGACVDHFQHWVYSNPDATPAERKERWSDLEKLYLPHRDYDDMSFPKSGGVWQGQLHIYQCPFYYIDYTLAQVCAMQFWIKFDQDHDAAWKDYYRLCKAGGSRPFSELVELAGLTSPFEEGTLKNVVGTIKNWFDGINVSNL